MSQVRDFESRSRSDTARTMPTQLPVPLSPITTDHPSLDRRGSTASKASRFSRSPSLRFRHPSRSNTVTTYHEPDPADLAWQPGAEPGIDPAADEQGLPAHIAALKANCEINIIDYSANPDIAPNRIYATNSTLEQALAQPRADGITCRWISVNGMSWDVIRILGNGYGIHRLAIEDILQKHTRTKVDWYADHACIILTLQKLVRLHQHEGSEYDCDCLEPMDDDPDQFDEKTGEPLSQPKKSWWWQRGKGKKAKRKSRLPYHLDRDDNGKIDEFVNAHSGLSEDSPIRPVRTLHRYESSKIPEHTAFMEKHSSLAAEDLAVSVEQVSLFLLADNTVISIFEQSAEDVENPILARINSTETMLRRSCDASLLLQAIIDAIVDLAIPVRDAYNKARKELQVDAMINPNIATSRALHIFGEEIDMLQNLLKPIVHLVNAIRDHNNDGPIHPTPNPSMAPADRHPLAPPVEISTPGGTSEPYQEAPMQMPGEKLRRDRQGAPVFNRKLSGYRRAGPMQKKIAEPFVSSVSITPLAHTYFGDVLDHCITMIQALEQMDASATNISTLIFNTVGARTNNFMMILAVVTVLFAPLTFISGYFGQNFSGGKGIDHPFDFFWLVALPVLAVFCLIVFATMLWDNIKDWFSKRGVRAHRNRRNKIRRSRFR